MPDPNAEETPKKETAEKPAKSSTISKLLMIIVIALVSSAGGGSVAWFLIARVAKAEAKAEVPVDPVKQKQDEVAEAIEKGGALPLEAFIVNLADTDAARYLRIKISLMVDEKAAIKELTENSALQMKVRDVIIQALTQKTSHELINDEGKTKLREELQEKIEGYFKKPKLVDVMFTDFVIQL